MPGPGRIGVDTGGMATHRIRVLVESAPKKVFVAALDWPGLARSGKDEGLAVQSLLEHLPRYAAVARRAGEAFPAEDVALEVVERHEGGSSTAFGVPSVTGDADRLPVDEAEAGRLTALVEASWGVFDLAAAAAPEELRKGPRGGGRDTSRIVAHVNDADGGYAQAMGIRTESGGGDAVLARRAAILRVLREPSDGSPIAGKRWTPRYAARRIAWHALDHAWEIEDRTEPDRHDPERDG
jgi:hypothetical protein